MQQVRHTVVSQATDSHPTGTATRGTVDLHHRPNGPWPSSAQSGIRRRMVLTVGSEILPITLVIHGKMYPTTDSSNQLMDTPADKAARLRTTVLSSVPFCETMILSLSARRYAELEM